MEIELHIRTADELDELVAFADFLKEEFTPCKVNITAGKDIIAPFIQALESRRRRGNFYIPEILDRRLHGDCYGD